MPAERPLPSCLVGALAAFAMLAAAAPGPAAAQSGGTPSQERWVKPAAPYFVGIGDRKWLQDYGVADGRCNRQAVDGVLKAGPTGPETPRAEVAMLRGGLVDATSVRDLGDADRACLGHALELAGDGRTVYWSDPTAGYAFRVTPLRTYTALGWPCREFTVEVTQPKRKPQFVRSRACRTGDGIWGIQA